MRLFKNIFDITDENLILLRYLRDHPGFFIQEISNKFDFEYQTFYKHLIEWEKQGYFTSQPLPPQLGKPKRKYFLSEKGIKRLKAIESDEL